MIRLTSWRFGHPHYDHNWAGASISMPSPTEDKNDAEIVGRMNAPPEAEWIHLAVEW